MTRKPYFSIVMPAYGVEAYIEQAIRSIQAQTESDREIIVVDDCAKDRSGEIADREAQKDERIRVLHLEENVGLSKARNAGMKEACGSYIWFMDPDDTVDKDVLEQVRRSLEKNPAEVVMFGLVEEYYNGKGALSYTHEICPEEKFCMGKEELRKEVLSLEQQTLYGYTWNKIYSLDYMRKLNLKFETVTLIEDIVFNVQYFMDIERLNILGIAPYHYAKRLEENLTNKFVPDYFALHKRRIEMIYDQHVYWNLCTKEVKQVLGGLYGRYILSALERNCDKRSGMDHQQRYMFCRALFCQGLFEDLIPVAKADESRTLKIALRLLKWKRTMLCLLMGRGIYIVRHGFPILYSKVKSGR